jgi:hypothetical protein
MKIFPSKDETSLQQSLLLEEKDILSDLTGEKGSSLFLGKYSIKEVAAVLRKRNFYKEAKKRDLWPLKYHLDNSEFPLQRFQIFHWKRQPQNLIVDLKLREGSFRPKAKLAFDLPLPKHPYNFLFLEWLTLQNPLLEFSKDRAPLPGQNHPGLNIGQKVMDIFIHLARLCKLDGILAYPAYFHNAQLFSRRFYFLNPAKQAEILAIRKASPKVTFKKLAWIVHLECLRDKDRNIFKWEAEEQLYPLNPTLKAFLCSKKYGKEVKRIQKNLSFFIDWECYEKKLP